MRKIKEVFRRQMIRRPPVFLTAAFCCGIAYAALFGVNFLAAYGFALGFLWLSLYFFRIRLTFEISLTCLAILIGMLALKNVRTVAGCDISRLVSYRNELPYVLKGFIDSEPARLKNNKLSFVLKPVTLQSGDILTHCCGRTLIYVDFKETLRYADQVSLAGNLYRPFSAAGGKRFKYNQYLADQGVFSVMNAKALNRAYGLRITPAQAFKRKVLGLKERIQNVIFRHLSLLPGSILEAMVLGEKGNIPPAVYNSMMKSGTVHILVVSGFNVGLVCFALTLFLKLIGINRTPRLVLVAFLLALYCLITGASDPVVRATVMAIIFLFSYYAKRQADVWNSLALAAALILGFRPNQLFDIGFQLSFMSVAAIVYLYPKLRKISGAEDIKAGWLRFLIDNLLISLSALAGTAPLIAYYFKIISPVAALANVFIVPIASLITLCGFSLIAVNLFLPFLAPYFAASSEFLVWLLLKTNAFLIRMPAAYFYLP